MEDYEIDEIIEKIKEFCVKHKTLILLTGGTILTFFFGKVLARLAVCAGVTYLVIRLAGKYIRIPLTGEDGIWK
ncbi:MAG: hypothetical protein MJ025_06105 [Victivallaceae bacterium]|nr:hypothetical protein [Victivallaceae bacterium]